MYIVIDKSFVLLFLCLLFVLYGFYLSFNGCIYNFGCEVNKSIYCEVEVIFPS